MDISQHWQAICHAIQEGVFLVDPSGAIVMANEGMSRLTGYSPQELIGQKCGIIGCSACEIQRKDAPGAWCRLFAGSAPEARRCILRRRDGSEVTVFKNQSLIRDTEGTVLGAVESVLDLTEIDRLDRKVEELSRLLDHPDTFFGMVGASPAMARLFDMLEKAAASDAPVLLLGESGTGKELAARAIHEMGARASGPYVQLNCAALNEALLESELFGHARGAFTGAVRQRQGRFEAAHQGDIFLDEIGDAPLSIQIKLLRVLETKTIERVGEQRPVKVDARLIAATNQDILRLIREGRFRDDFYFRINVIPIVLPPLREHSGDIPLLASHFIRIFSAKTGKQITSLSPEALDLFMRYPWPGNVRELKSALEYAFVVAQSGAIGPEHLPPGLGAMAADRALAPPPSGKEADERSALLVALKQANGNKSQAARLLGVNRLTVQNRMRKYAISCERVLNS